MGALPTGVRAEPGVGPLRSINLAALRAQADARRPGRRSLRMNLGPTAWRTSERYHAKFCMPLMGVPSIQRRRPTDTISGAHRLEERGLLGGNLFQAGATLARLHPDG